MDGKLARWAQITLWDRPALDRLHRQELAAGRDWHRIFMQTQDFYQAQFQMKPYWPEKMPDSEQNMRLMDFNRDIFPVWGKILDAWEKTWSLETDSEYEIVIMHRCDDLIFNSGIKVNRLYLGDPQKFRDQQARSDRYSRQAAEAMR